MNSTAAEVEAAVFDQAGHRDPGHRRPWVALRTIPIRGIGVPLESGHPGVDDSGRHGVAADARGASSRVNVRISDRTAALLAEYV
ncbi:hypothetical protein NRF20_02990 [Streptomyces sp. R-74717]|uniref:hypothetical protein n=1 Tax=Streptomyces TaxID=1883 RepID=UPI0037AE6677